MKPQYFEIEDFSFKSGKELSSLKLEYATLGNKRTDRNGQINNALLFLHGWSGDYSSINNINKVIGPGKAVDTEKYFIICPTSLGTPGSSSPSNSGLGINFPFYSIEDMVQAQYDLITQRFKIKHLKGVIGSSMGGFQTLQWAVSYPRFLDFIIPIATTGAVRGQISAVYHLMNELITDSEEYKHGLYSENPVDIMKKAFVLTYLFSFSPEYFKKQFRSGKKLLEALSDRKEEAKEFYANDIVWRNKAMLSFNIEHKLSQIKAKTLIIGIKQDQFFPPTTDTIPLYEAIHDSELYFYDSYLGHYGCVEDIHLASSAIKNFLKDK